MYARILTFSLKPNHLSDFRETLDKQVLPMLRKQEGFKDNMTFVGPSGTEIHDITLWDKKENAASYDSATYPEVLKVLSSVLEGTPQIKTFDVINSTFHKIPVLAAV